METLCTWKQLINTTAIGVPQGGELDALKYERKTMVGFYIKTENELSEAENNNNWKCHRNEEKEERTNKEMI